MIELARDVTGAGPAEAAELGDFAGLVRQHQAMVFSIAYHFLHDRSLAEELAQEVFFQLYRNLKGLRSATHVKHWLRRVASHRCIDYSRHRSNEATLSIESIPEPSTAPDIHDPMLAGSLRKLVASLPVRPRLVVLLRYQEDLQPEEISRVLDMPVGTVKSQLQRALAKLREKASRTMGEVNL